MLLQVYRKVCFRATIVFHIYQQPTRRSNIDYHGYTMFFSKANIRNISETHPTKAYIKEVRGLTNESSGLTSILPSNVSLAMEGVV